MVEQIKEISQPYETYLKEELADALYVLENCLKLILLPVTQSMISLGEVLAKKGFGFFMNPLVFSGDEYHILGNKVEDLYFLAQMKYKTQSNLSC